MTEQERINKFAMLADDMFGIVSASTLVNKLENLNYFKQPASVKHHGNYEGGLFDHSWAVMEALEDLTYKLDLQWSDSRSLYIVGLFHDLCKCNDYIYNKEYDKWEYNNDKIMTGHGELSVIMAQQLVELTDEEIACIRWHLGAYDITENWNVLGRAIEKYPNVLYTHTADMIASRIQGI